MKRICSIVVLASLGVACSSGSSTSTSSSGISGTTGSSAAGNGAATGGSTGSTGGSTGSSTSGSSGQYNTLTGTFTAPGLSATFSGAVNLQYYGDDTACVATASFTSSALASAIFETSPYPAGSTASLTMQLSEPGAPGPGGATPSVVIFAVNSSSGQLLADYGGTSSFDIYSFDGGITGAATDVEPLTGSNGIYFAHGYMVATLANTQDTLPDGGFPTGILSATW